LALAPCRGQETFSVPERFPVDRYAKILEHSPFAQATLLQEAAPQENFAKDLVLVSHYRFNGVLYINLMHRQSQKRLVATSGTASADGLLALSLDANSNPWLTKAVVESHGQKGTVGYDPPNFPQPTAAQSVAAAQPHNGQPAPVQRTRVRSAQDD
jgi:hypothetical protein